MQLSNCLNISTVKIFSLPGKLGCLNLVTHGLELGRDDRVQSLCYGVS